MNDLKYSNYDFSKIPFNDIVKVGQRTLLYRDLFTVSWLLGRFCNYKCHYCWPYARSDEKDHRPLSLILSTIDEIKKQARQNKFNSFHFSFSGGEPTLHKNYLDILKYYSDDDNSNYQSCHMTTNLSPGIKWFEKYIDYTKKLNRVSITASWHRKGWKPNNDPSNDEIKNHMIEFADKIEILQQNAVQITINMVMVPELFEELWNEAEYFHSRNINVTLKPQSNSTATKVVDGYTDDMLNRLHNGMPQCDYTALKQNFKRKEIQQKLPPVEIENLSDTQTMQVEMEDSTGKKYYMDQAERFNAFNFNNFCGWKCNSGFQGIIIREPDGSIKRSYSCNDKPLGNIETGFKLFDQPTICTTTSCVSSADSKLPKRKI